MNYNKNLELCSGLNYNKIIEISRGKIYLKMIKITSEFADPWWHRLDGPAWEGKDGKIQYWINNEVINSLREFKNHPEVIAYKFKDLPKEDQEYANSIMMI